MPRSQTDEISEGNLGLKEVRCVYLITCTYSHVDMRKVPFWQRFTEIVLEVFELHCASVVQWACCKEPHRAGGVHFHMAIKLLRPKRWLAGSAVVVGGATSSFFGAQDTLSTGHSI